MRIYKPQAHAYRSLQSRRRLITHLTNMYTHTRVIVRTQLDIFVNMYVCVYAERHMDGGSN